MTNLVLSEENTFYTYLDYEIHINMDNKTVKLSR